jgi:2-methylfumaryl-CoA isomerase
MASLLGDLRIIEISAFIAAPLGGMTLAQLGADVIRIDPIGGGIDSGRWPLAPNGRSLYWSSLNKSKRSITLALNTEEGREIALALATSSNPGAGIALTNFPAKGWLAYEKFAARRRDFILLRLNGNPDGTSAVDYTVNCASGFPLLTGDGSGPVNHVLPAWDVAAGLYLATGLLAAERYRSRTGEGEEVTLSLADVMLATVGNLGLLADAQINGHHRQAIGNNIYGVYGQDFATADYRRVMIVAISNGQWSALLKATGLSRAFDELAQLAQVDLSSEGGRFAARDAISQILAPWFAARSLQELTNVFSGTAVLWGPYQDLGQLLAEDARCSVQNPLFRLMEEAGFPSVMTPHIPLQFRNGTRGELKPAPVYGEHTDEVLLDVLGLSSQEVGRLHDRGIAAGQSSPTPRTTT